MNQKRLALFSTGAALLLTGAALLSRYQLVAWEWLPRQASFLDLTDRSLSATDFEQIQQALPDCRIRWSVPFQGRTLDSDIQTLTVREMAPEDWAALELLPDLTTLDLCGIQDYDRILTFQQRHPDCRVLYTVGLGEADYLNDTTFLTLAHADVRELTAGLPRLPSIREVTLTGTLPSGQELTQLRQAFPQIDFRWTVTLSGTPYDSSTRQLSVKDKPLTAQELEEAISRLPELTRADIRGCGLTDAEAKALCDRFPNCFFLWEMTIGEQVFPTDVTELDVSGIPFESREEIERLLPYFGNLERVVMCNCGLDNETMDALNQTYPDIRFVWSVRIRYYDIRTDATYFYPFKLQRDLFINNEEASLLRYCTDMVCIDVGHMGQITDCEWAAYMPNLKYLVIIETAITDISPLSACKELVFLEIFTTKITDYSPLLECTKLEDLNLGKTYGDPTPISKMTWLKHIWWSGVDGTYGNPASNAKVILTDALPNTEMHFHLETPNVDNGWRQLDNYYAMRDYMDIFYLK